MLELLFWIVIVVFALTSVFGLVLYWRRNREDWLIERGHVNRLWPD